MERLCLMTRHFTIHQYSSFNGLKYLYLYSLILCTYEQSTYYVRSKMLEKNDKKALQFYLETLCRIETETVLSIFFIDSPKWQVEVGRWMWSGVCSDE